MQCYLVQTEFITQSFSFNKDASNEVISSYEPKSSRKASSFNKPASNKGISQT